MVVWVTNIPVEAFSLIETSNFNTVKKHENNLDIIKSYIFCFCDLQYSIYDTVEN